MKCYCCDKILSTQESVRRFKETGAFVDMCNTCLSTIDDEIEVVDSPHLSDDEYDEEGGEREWHS